MKTAELTDEQLDRWVAKAIALTAESALDFGLGCPDWLERFNPSTNWAHGGPIIDASHISLDWDERSSVPTEWEARLYHDPPEDGGATLTFKYGPTALIAAMRAKVASVYGDEVPDNGFEAYIGTEYTKAEADRLRARQRVTEINALQPPEVASQPDPR